MKSSPAVFFRYGLFCCCAALLLCAPDPAAASQEAGRVITLTPGVTVQRGGKIVPLAMQDVVQPGDTLITDASGRVRVLFGDDGSIALGSNTVFTLEAYVDEGSKSNFSGRMAKGLLRSITGRIVEQNPSGFALTTPEATIGIRGSIVSVRSGGGSTTVFVENTLRQVFVNNSNVPQLHKIRIAPGQPTNVTPITPQDRREIGRDLAFLGGNGSAAAAPEPGTGTAATVANNLTASANNALSAPALANLAVTDVAATDLSALANNSGASVTPPPLAPPTALVSGSLSSTATLTTFSGTFSFSIDLQSGAISGGTITGSGTNTAFGIPPNNSPWTIDFFNGSGIASSSGYRVSNFSNGSGTSFLGVPMIPLADQSYLDESVDLSTIANGGSVPANYAIFNGTTYDSGTGSGTLTK